MKSLPAIAHLDYFDVALLTLQKTGANVDDARIAIGRAVEELALRGEARQTRDWRHPLAYRDTVVDSLRELMRWNWVEATPLADTAEAFDRIRTRPVRLTVEGERISQLGAAVRRDAIGQKLLVNYSLFLDLLTLLERYDVVVPELSDAVIKSCFRDVGAVAEDQDAWLQVAVACQDRLRGHLHAGRPRVCPPPVREKLSAEIGRHLRRRFLKRPPKTLKEVTGAVNKAIAQAILRACGFHGDWNVYDRCLRWGRDLFLTNDGRYVSGIDGWVAWSASKVIWGGDAFIVERRGINAFGDEVRAALIEAYGRIAEGHRSGGVQVPLIPIYQVRETAAFACKVCDEVADRVLSQMASQRREGDPLVQLHLGDLRDFVPSARPFRFINDDKRYFYVSMYQPDQTAEGK